MLVGDRERDRTATRADVEHPRCLEPVQKRESALDDDLSLGPRDERPAVDGQRQAAEPPLAEDVRDGLAGRYDLVVSNPPYVSPGEIEALEPEVRDWEPRLATVGEEQTELIARAARDVLVPGGALVLEVADGESGRVSALLRELGYEEVRAGQDLAGRDRVVEGRWPTSSGQ